MSHYHHYHPQLCHKCEVRHGYTQSGCKQEDINIKRDWDKVQKESARRSRLTPAQREQESQNQKYIEVGVTTVAVTSILLLAASSVRCILM
jgi:hypothetical protein